MSAYVLHTDQKDNLPFAELEGENNASFTWIRWTENPEYKHIYQHVFRRPPAWFHVNAAWAFQVKLRGN